MMQALRTPAAPSGQTKPRVLRAAMSQNVIVLPSPGSPMMIASLPRGIRPGHVHVTGSGSTSASVTSRG